MNTYTPLSLDGSFEKIVNSGTSRKRAATNRWIRKTIETIVILLGIELFSLILFLFKAISSVPTVYISVIVFCCVAFLAGRIYEKCTK